MSPDRVPWRIADFAWLTRLINRSPPTRRTTGEPRKPPEWEVVLHLQSERAVTAKAAEIETIRTAIHADEDVTESARRKIKANRAKDTTRGTFFIGGPWQGLLATNGWDRPLPPDEPPLRLAGGTYERVDRGYMSWVPDPSIYTPTATTEPAKPPARSPRAAKVTSGVVFVGGPWAGMSRLDPVGPDTEPIRTIFWRPKGPENGAYVPRGTHYMKWSPDA